MGPLQDEDYLEESDRDCDLSGDEASPDQPSTTGLFKPALFRILLHKAKLVMGCTADPAKEPIPACTPRPLLTEPQPESDHFPASEIFSQNVKRPWQHPAAALGPSLLEKKYYTFDEELETLLQYPTVDTPVVSLVSNAAVPAETGDNLRPEERKAENLLKKTHQLASWGFRAAAAASFFSRASIRWLEEMISRLTPEDTRWRQDLNKLLAAAEFMADATIHAAKFSARGMAATVASRRLLWLKNWQADAKSKWRLASAPYQSPQLFGEALEKVLIEDKDKRKVLPRSFRRQDRRTTPYARRQPFRWEPSTTSGQQRPFQQPRFGQQPFRGERYQYQDRSRGFQQGKRSFRGNAQRGARRPK